MQAIILTGGKGIRLRPYTTVIPKPLMPVGDMPFLEIILRQLMNMKFWIIARTALSAAMLDRFLILRLEWVGRNGISDSGPKSLEHLTCMF